MARRYYSTTAQRTTLASSCTDSATTIVVTAATGFPSSVPFPLVLDADTVNEEAVLVTSRVGTTCTVTRAYDGTTGVAHSAGATVRHTALALDFNEASEHVNETTTAHGLTLADVITTSNTKTLTNKTLTAPTIADFTNANHDHGDADDGGTLPASSVLNRPINAQSGTTYTFALADASKHVTGSSGSSSTFTIPLQASVTWLSDARIPVTNVGAGVMTLAITGGGTLNGSDLTIAQGESVLLLRTASDVWWCLPFSTGSALARGTLSGTTGSPATSSNGGATAYKWTADGTFTVATAGLFTCRGVGGGGGGGAGLSGYGAGGGGGAGGHAVLTDIYLAAGTYTVKVGAGGAGGSTVGSNGLNGVSSALGPFVFAGGGGGAAATTSTSDSDKNGSAGGSGGGGCGGYNPTTGGTPTQGQGYAGGNSTVGTGGAPGGGGGGAVGANSTSNPGGAGGAGVADSITGSSVTLAGGGGGGDYSSGGGGAGGSGGGGAGGSISAGTAATANTGGGGGGGSGGGTSYAGAAGGSGVVVLLVGTV